MQRSSDTAVHPAAPASKAHPRVIAVSNSLSRLGITAISARSITMCQGSLSVCGAIRVAGGEGQALLGKLSELELLCSAGGRQWHLVGSQENHVSRHFEAGES